MDTHEKADVDGKVPLIRKTTTRDKLNWLIHLLYSRGEHDECLRLIEAQLRSCNGMSEYPLFIKGLILREKGNLQESLELFQAATLLNPSNPDNLKQIGRTLFLSGKHSAAADVLDEASQNGCFEDWQVYHNKGMCFMYLQEYDKALESFENANSIQRHDCTFLEMGKVYGSKGRYEDALNVYLEALEFSPENTELLTTIGLTYLRLDENMKAFDYLGNSLTHDPTCPKTILAAGSVIQDHQDMDVALIKYRVAAVKTPNCALLWNNIGMCFFGKEKYMAAISCLRRSLYLDPFQWITAHNLGLVFLHNEQNASAFHYLSASINLRPDSPSSYMYLGITLCRLEDFENAVAAYKKSIELDPQDPVTYLNYAAMLQNRGQLSNSKAQFQTFCQMIEQLSAEERLAVAETTNSLYESLAKIHTVT